MVICWIEQTWNSICPDREAAFVLGLSHKTLCGYPFVGEILAGLLGFFFVCDNFLHQNACIVLLVVPPTFGLYCNWYLQSKAACTYTVHSQSPCLKPRQKRPKNATSPLFSIKNSMVKFAFVDPSFHATHKQNAWLLAKFQLNSNPNKSLA